MICELCSKIYKELKSNSIQSIDDDGSVTTAVKGIGNETGIR